MQYDDTLFICQTKNMFCKSRKLDPLQNRTLEDSFLS